MFCNKCGNKLDDGVKFCPMCGATIGEVNEENRVNTTSSLNNPKPGTNNSSVLKINKIIAILNIVMGGIILLITMIDIDLEWAMYSLWLAIGLLVIGILQLLRKSTKVISIIEIVTGSLTFLASLACDLQYDWPYVGLLAGISLLVTGILSLLHKSVKAIAIIQIVFGGLILLLGLAGMEYDYGWIALGVTASFLTAGILKLINLKSYRQ